MAPMLQTIPRLAYASASQTPAQVPRNLKALEAMLHAAILLDAKFFVRAMTRGKYAEHYSAVPVRTQNMSHMRVCSSQQVVLTASWKATQAGERAATCRDTTDASAEIPKHTSPAQCNLSWYHTLRPAQNKLGSQSLSVAAHDWQVAACLHAADSGSGSASRALQQLRACWPSWSLTNNT